MPRLIVHGFTLSLDGCGAGPQQSLEAPLGIGDEALHERMLRSEQQGKQFLARHLMMCRDIAKYACQRTDLDRPVIRNGDVMRAVAGSGQADVTSALPCHLVSQLTQRLDQFLDREVARDPHAAITISFTMCRRITLGI